MKKLAILASLLLVTACGAGNKGGDTAEKPADSGSKSTSSDSSGGIILGGTSDKPMAEVNGIVITEADVTEKIGNRLSRLETQVFDIQMQGINSLIDEKVLEAAAKKEGISAQELLKKEVDSKVSEPSEEQLKQFYEANKARLRGQSFEAAKANLKRQLAARQKSVYRNALLDKLKDDAEIKVHLSRPTVDVSADDDPWRGGKDAKVTIIEFTDYQCPFCARARPTVKQVLDTYGDKVKYVLRDFPLSFHPQAQKAAEGAQCAGDQDKYWEYSDKLWANIKALDVPNLKKYAKEVGLDQDKFNKCLDDGKYTAEVKKDMADGSKAGVSGTPSFFINGQMITGARPFQQFKEIIDMELRTN